MQTVFALLPLLALVVAVPAPLIQTSIDDLPTAIPSINIRARSIQSTTTSPDVRLTSTPAATLTTTSIQIATPRQPHTTIVAPRLPFTTTVSTIKTTIKSTTTTTKPVYTNRPFKIALLPITATSNNTNSTAPPPAPTPVGYLGTDASNAWSLSNLISLRKLQDKAATFELGPKFALKQRLPAQPRTLLRVQAAKSGQNYAGLGAAQNGFGNGENLICKVDTVSVTFTGPKGKVRTRSEDRLRCTTAGNGYSILGKCKRFSWMWLFGSVADVKTFCPGGSGALEMGIIWL